MRKDENRLWRILWFYGFVAISVLLLVATRFGGYFSLRNENNAAALFSGMLLLIVAIHAFDGWALFRESRIRVAKAWLCLSAVLVALSFDEIGSLHERIPSVGQLSTWWSYLPFAIVLITLLTYSLVQFVSDEEHRGTAWLVALAFALFASVALQEFIEHRVEWPERIVPYRAIVEEGTELLAMLILLRVSMVNTQGMLGRNRETAGATFEAITALRRPIVAVGLVLAPLVAYVTAILPPDRYGHGQPADWPAAAVFLLAAIAAARCFFVDGRAIGRLAWALTLLCCLGCLSTTLHADSRKSLLAVGVVCLFVVATWVLDPAYVARNYAPAAAVLALLMLLYLTFRASVTGAYWLTQCIALTVYYVNSARLCRRARSS